MERVNFVYNGANQIACLDGNENGSCGDAEDILYTYDPYGNLVGDGSKAYTYDAANRLVRVSDGVSTTTYDYNGDGDRVSQTAGGVTTTYVIDAAAPLTLVLAETTGMETIYYLHGLGLVAQSDGVSTEYFAYDGLGSVRQVLSSAGEALFTQGFDPYGNPYASVGTKVTHYGFTGEQTDENGLVFLRARYYQPSQGRFLQRDPWKGDQNAPMSYNAWLYAYSNPLVYVDPSGNIPESFPRPVGVCPYPPENATDPQAKLFYFDKNKSKVSIYCGEFKLTAYQFVVDSGYDDSVMITGQGFSLPMDFALDTRNAGTGKSTRAEGTCDQGYIQKVSIYGDTFTYRCGKGKQYDPTKYKGKVVAADLRILKLESELYLPRMCYATHSCTNPIYYPYVTVKDEGGNVIGNHLDIFTGEGPGLNSSLRHSSPSAIWKYEHTYLGETRLDHPPHADARGPTPVYQVLSTHHQLMIGQALACLYDLHMY